MPMAQLITFGQCVLGTFVDAYYRGYDCILLKDATATTSPEGGYANVVYNAGNVRACPSAFARYSI